MQPIGIAASPADLETAAEFFELFKTPWEPVVRGRAYDVVLSSEPANGEIDARVLLLYGSGEADVDRESGVAGCGTQGPVQVQSAAAAFPVYGRIATFGPRPATLRSAGAAVDYRQRTANRLVWRIGYDLFEEVRRLLTHGQPSGYAGIPTLDHHVTVLRSLLLESGVSFVEIPPRPAGHDFICCLTHDVDFFGVRRHWCDRTLAGFVARASIGSLLELARGRRPLSDAARNWAALVSLPFVFLGLVPDFWRPFEAYAEVEEGRRSTFFLVPFRGRAGLAPDGSVDRRRAAPYQADEIRDEMRSAAARGSELAVHGIDAWRNADAGRAELDAVAAAGGRRAAGVRMHWLYLAADSPRALEAAGFDYDSTWGYNDAIGYRAGTSQVFRLPASERLLELPLSIMDSALFYPTRMALSKPEAGRRCREIVEHARRTGGTVVINWHDRSLAPERLWGAFYRELLEQVGAGGRTWFATGQQAVDWFRWRRAFRFARGSALQTITVQGAPPPRADFSARVRVHRPAAETREFAFDGRQPLTVSC